MILIFFSFYRSLLEVQSVADLSTIPGVKASNREESELLLKVCYEPTVESGDLQKV